MSKTRKLTVRVLGPLAVLGMALSLQLSSSAASANDPCKGTTSGDYGDFTPDAPVSGTSSCPTSTPKPTPKPTSTPKPTPTSPPKTQSKPKPRPVVQSKPAPRPVAKAKPAPKPVVRQDAKPPAKISATAVKVCVIRVKVTNSGGTAAQVKIGTKIVTTLAPKQTKTVDVPVGPDGKWSIKVTGPGYSKVFAGGCDCAKVPAKPIAAASASVTQDAVPTVEWQFPWLVVGGAALLASLGGGFLGHRLGRKPKPAPQD